MKFLVLSVVLFECLFLARSEEDLFLANLKHQFADVPKDVKLFDFLQSEDNLKGLLGLHNNMCEQLVYYNGLKLKSHRGKRDAEETTTEGTAATLGVDEAANTTVDASTVDASTVSDSTTAGGSESTTAPASSTVQRRRRDATDSSASTTNSTASPNPADDKDQQQNLNDQQPPADDQGDQPAPAGGEAQEAEIQAAGAAYFKQLILNVLRYILNCLMTYINMFY